MKKIIFVLLLVFINVLNAQFRGNRAMPVELYLIGKSTLFPFDSTEFNMQAISQVWGDATSYPNTNTPIPLSNEMQNLTYTVENDNNFHSGWDFVTSNTLNNTPFGYGKYKLTAEISRGNSNYIFLDYRDHKYYLGVGGITGAPIDVWIRYDNDLNKFYVNSYSGHVLDPHWEEVPNGSTVKIWELKGMGEPSTYRFEPAPPENFFLTESDETWPTLYWEHSSIDDYCTSYEIYRSITEHFYDVRNYSFLTEVDNTITSYADTNVYNDGWGYAHYYVVSKNVNVLSQPTNEETVLLTTLFNKEIQNSEKTCSNKKTTLTSYPNPFNPVTKISYTIPKASYVKLEVYNSLGKKVETLVNETKEAGSYTAHFNGTNLSSGIYIYQLQTEETTISKKMILVK